MCNPDLRDNPITLVVDGDATFASILDGIDAAEEPILFRLVIVQDEDSGREVRARAGVRMALLCDRGGSRDLPWCDHDELS